MRNVMMRIVFFALLIIFVQNVAARAHYSVKTLPEQKYDEPLKVDIQIKTNDKRDIGGAKRVSDQRLAELETLVGLSKMNGKVVSQPVGFGKYDLNEIGRKRRSDRLFDMLFNRVSSEENNTDPLESNYEEIYKKR